MVITNVLRLAIPPYDVCITSLTLVRTHHTINNLKFIEIKSLDNHRSARADLLWL